MSRTPVWITGAGAVCAAGATPAAIWDALMSARPAVGAVRRWDARGWPPFAAGEVSLAPRDLVADRKSHKVLARSDMLGLYAAGQAVEAAGWPRDGLDENTAVYAGAGGGAYESQYDFLPLLARAQGDLRRFGGHLGDEVNPLWLLGGLPNNVLCHLGIRFGFKGPNACFTTHSIGGALAAAEGLACLREGDAARAVAVAHDAALEPETARYLHRLGVLTSDVPRPFDAVRDGAALGEGAAAVALEPESAAVARGATRSGELVGAGAASECESLLDTRADGDGLARAIELALDDAGIDAVDVGAIIAHGNATAKGDASEVAALRRVFGRELPPVTAFKWCFGHTFAAAALLDVVLALEMLRRKLVPGVATLGELDPDFEGLPISASPRELRGDVALVLSRGFAGTNAALVLRA